jgi:hypothetical protein
MLSKGQRATQRAALTGAQVHKHKQRERLVQRPGAPAREQCDACRLCDLRERAHAPMGTTSEPTESECAAEGLRANAQGQQEEKPAEGGPRHVSPPRPPPCRTTYCATSVGTSNERNAASAPRDAYAPMRWRVSGQVAVREEESSVYGAAFLSLRGSVARLSLASHGC